MADGPIKKRRIPGVPKRLLDPNRTETDTFTVSRVRTVKRLDLFLLARYPGYSRSHMQRLIREGAVTVNGAAAKPSQDLYAGAEVRVTLPAIVEASLEPEDIPLEILHEDEDLFVVNKPARMVVHPGKGNMTGTLVHALLFHSRELSASDNPLKPGLVHRLDKDTSGAIIVAKNDRTHWKLAEQFQARTVAKAYLAVVRGVPELRSDIISLRLGRHLRDRQKIAVRRDSGREAQTFYTVAETYGRYALVVACPKTGRTHQIRVHLAAAGHPIAADFLYGHEKEVRAADVDPDGGDEVLLERQALHAGAVAFTHPTTGKRLRFVAPVPPDMAGLVARLRRRAGLPEGALDGEGVWKLVGRVPDFAEKGRKRPRRLGPISGTDVMPHRGHR